VPSSPEFSGGSLLPVSIWAPPLTFRLPTTNWIFPALPAPLVSARILPSSSIAKKGVVTETSPALAVPRALLYMPLGDSPVGSSPDMETDSLALTVKLPPMPLALLETSTWAPPVNCRRPTSSKMLPAAPSSAVNASMSPLSTVNVGHDMVSDPPAPFPSVPALTRLCRSGFFSLTPDIDT